MKLPKVLYSALGPISVERVESIPNGDPGSVTMGQYNLLSRSIRLSKEVTSDESTLATMGHEWAHAALNDAGVSNLLSHEMEEAVCDVFGALIAGAILNGYLAFKNGR